MVALCLRDESRNDGDSCCQGAHVQVSEGWGRVGKAEIERHKQMISYTELVQKLSRENIDFVIVDDDKRFSLLNDQARADCSRMKLILRSCFRCISKDLKLLLYIY
jgi:hypothetical protein